MNGKSKKAKAMATAVPSEVNTPPPPPWDDTLPYDPANPNEALGNALLTGSWAGEDISVIRRVDSKQLWAMWRTTTIRPL